MHQHHCCCPPVSWACGHLQVSNTPYMIIFGAIQLVFSQLPDFDKLYGLSYLAAAMSFTYSFIALGLVIDRAAGECAQHPSSPAALPVGTKDSLHWWWHVW